MADNEFEFTDRYAALGMNPPDVDTMCKGQCEGIGRYPVNGDDIMTDYERAEWIKLHCSKTEANNCMKTHFIACPECRGTGKRNQSNG